MTTVDIESMANDDNIAAPDMPIKTILRNYVVPQFYIGIGDVRWRRISTTLTLSVGVKKYDLPNDFHKMTDLFMPPVGSQTLTPGTDRVAYIGEDASMVAQADFSNINAKPTGYYLTRRASGNQLKAISFNAPPDAAYVAYYSYLSGSPFTDLTTTVDMDQYIPTLIQPALVSGLRAQILKRRYGQKDDRYLEEKQTFDGWIESVRENTDQARRNFKSFVA